MRRGTARSLHGRPYKRPYFIEVTREGLFEQVTYNQRSEESEGAGGADGRRKNIPDGAGRGEGVGGTAKAPR